MTTDRAVVATPPAPPRIHPPADPGGHAPGDGGFSLIEVLVAIAVIGTVMASIGPFLVQSLTVSHQQRDKQVAVQVASDGLERVHALDPSSLLTGRGKPATQAQWTSAPAGLSKTLAGMEQAWDPMLPDTSPSGAKAPLPTDPAFVTLNGTKYLQRWFVGLCWQAKAVPTQPAIGDCTPTVTQVPFFRVVVAVTWKHRACPDGDCLYIASTLVSKGADPVFDTKRPAPTITDPGNQNGFVATAVDLQLTSTGGRLPLTWSVTGLPPGLTMSSTARITGTPTTAGTYTVTVTVTDRDKRTDDSTFTWTIVDPPLVVTSPGDQVSRTGTAVSLAVPATGGRRPLTWKASGLPTGLTISASTGAITGTPTTTQTWTTTVTVTDASNPARTSSVSFNWRVLTPVQLYKFSSIDVDQGTNAGNFTPIASGGQKPYTWEATNLPAGLTMNPSTGGVNGTITSGTRYLTTVVVTDSAGDKDTMTVVVNVKYRDKDDVRVTAPNPSSPDRSTAVGATISLQVAAGGGTPAYSGSTPVYRWTGANLPPGLSLDTAGLITGTPTTRGTYVVTLTARDSTGKLAILMFTWNVT